MTNLFKTGVVASIVAASFIPTAMPAQAQQLPCFSDIIPLAATAEQSRAVFCNLTGQGTDTAVRGVNNWVDDFTHGQSLTNFPTTSYKVYDGLGGVAQSKHFLHADHWMVDIAPESDGSVGASMISPDKTFKFENGVLSVENVLAAGHQDYTGNNWHEVILTTAAAPHTDSYKGLYGYEQFSGKWSLGMRMQSDRLPIVALFRPDGTRAWEASFWQLAGTDNFGGGPWGELSEVWRVCAKGTMDMGCRDAFRWEVRPTAITLYVNGVKYWEQTGLPELPAELLTGDNHVYMSSTVWREPATVVRFHWDSLRINMPMGVAPEPTHSPMPSVTPMPTTSPTPAPTTTPVPSATPTPQQKAEAFADDMLEYFEAPRTNRNIRYLKKLYTTIASYLGV